MSGLPLSSAHHPAVPLAALPLSRHARARMQQRGITRSALDRLLDWGREAYAGHGSTIVYFDGSAYKRAVAKPARKRAGLALPGCTRPELDCLRRLYAVLSSEGDVVTVGHRYRRIGRPS